MILNKESKGKYVWKKRDRFKAIDARKNCEISPLIAALLRRFVREAVAIECLSNINMYFIKSELSLSVVMKGNMKIFCWNESIRLVCVNRFPTGAHFPPAMDAYPETPLSSAFCWLFRWECVFRIQLSWLFGQKKLKPFFPDNKALTFVGRRDDSVMRGHENRWNTCNIEKRTQKYCLSWKFHKAKLER